MLTSGDTSHLQRQGEAQFEGVEDDTPANGIQRQAGVAKILSDKICFWTKKVARDKDDIL